MYKVIENFDHDIFTEKEGPYVSIYQNTHKRPRNVEQDIITFKNHLKTVKESLLKSYKEEEVKKLLEPLYNLEFEKDFWNHNREGFALFANPSDFVVLRLSNKVRERAIVADSFHKKPLIRYLQTRGAFDVLTLSKDNFALYTCTKELCHKVDFENDVAVTKEEVLGTLDESDYLSHASYNGASKEAMYHGHEDTKSIEKKDKERYFRYVDRFIAKTYSNPTKRPLVLWALAEHQGVFRKLSNNEHLVSDGVLQSDKDITESDVLEEAWSIIKPIYDQEIQELIERYKQAHSKGMASDNIHVIGKKLLEGNIETAIISSDKMIPGKVNMIDGSIIEGQLENPTQDDVLDDLAEGIMNQGGQVLVLADDDIPTDTGILVIYRYES